MLNIGVIYTVQTEIMDSLYNMFYKFIIFIPTLVGILFLLVMGIVLGKSLGKIGAKILEK